MNQSILFRLTAAFSAVILVGVVVTAFLATRTTTSDFQLYVTRSGQQSAAHLASVVADYYARNGKWDGVDQVLQEASGAAMGGGMMGGRSPMMSGWQGWAMLNLRVILLDERGSVVVDSTNAWIGQTLNTSTIAGAQAIQVNNRQVGTLIVTSLDAPIANSPAGDFLSSINRSILIAALFAGVVALALGLVLFRQITAPLESLTRAAKQIERGDLQGRVPVKGSDELAEVSRAFNAMTASLAQMQTARRNQIADIAHELRTPLAVLRANLEAMLDGVMPINAEQIAEIHAETLHLARLVDDLRLLSLAETGQLELKRAPIDLGALVRDVVDRADAAFREKGVGLELNAAGAAQIAVDADRIVQVLQNLLDNALRYTPRGGVVSVQCSVISDPSAVKVSVSDTGEGIAPDELPYVFERFYRADKSRARTSGGSGLGLAIVKQLVQAHGGRVGVESEASKGTRFWFVIPT